MLTILKCPGCGKVFPNYNSGHTRALCPNTKVCTAKFWIDNDSTLTIKFGTDFIPEKDVCYIYINVFNSNCFLAARAYSEDGNNFMVIPLNERYIGGITRKDTLSAIPTDLKHTTAWDGLVIKSGCYPVSAEMEKIITSKLYIMET